MCLHVLLVFEAEVACRLQDWTHLQQVIERAARSEALPADTFEVIGDLLWAEKDCPVHVLFPALEAILHASLDQQSLSVEKFSRWLRAICTSLLSRNTAPDRLKAVGYIEQAISVLKEHCDLSDTSDQVYPIDERYWLMATAYNTGIECFHVSLLEEAKRWFEASAVVCRYVPDGESRARKVSETYANLLDRFAS